MLTFDATTRASLAGATSKTDWANRLGTALGPTRRVRCYDGSGTEVRNVGSTGALTVSAGGVVGLGTLKGTTISLAAPMANPGGTLRIEGRGNTFVAGTLGLSAAAQAAAGVATAQIVAYDFTLSKALTAANGLAIAGFNIGAYRFLPSGVGALAPAFTSAHPAKLTIQDWSSGSAVAVGSISFNFRASDLVFQDAEIGGVLGDVAIYQSTQTVKLISNGGNIFEFGATLIVSDKANTKTGTAPLFQVLVGCCHRGTAASPWTNYPQPRAGLIDSNSGNETFSSSTGGQRPYPYNMNPGAFKAVLTDAQGNVLYTFQMHDGLPINDPSLQTQGRSASKPTRPRWNCAQLLYWQSDDIPLSPLASKFYPGMGLQRPSMGKSYLSVLDDDPVITGGGYSSSFSTNGLKHLMAMDQWPRPAAPWNPVTPDPYLNRSGYTRSGSDSQFADTGAGWDAEPGSSSGHGGLVGPGGPRDDRNVLPAIYAEWVSNPTGSRLQDNVPWATIAQGWTKAYANTSTHWFSDPRTLALDTDANVLGGGWMATGQYYGNSPIPAGLRAVYQGANCRDDDGVTPNSYTVCPDGSRYLNSHGIDGLHDYGAPYLAAILMRSPAHAVIAKMRFNLSCMIQGAPPGSKFPNQPTGNKAADYYMNRAHAWYLKNHVFMWKIGAVHPLGYKQSDTADRLALHLNDVVQNIYNPAIIQSANDRYNYTLRNLGTCYYQTQYNYWDSGGQLAYYMSSVLVFMKQTGAWSAMRSRDANSKLALDFQVQCMDRFCFDYLLDTTAGPSAGAYPGWPASSATNLNGSGSAPNIQMYPPDPVYPGSGYIVAGTYANLTLPLLISINGGAFAALPAGSTVAGGNISLAMPAPPATKQTVVIRDSATTPNQATFIVSPIPSTWAAWQAGYGDTTADFVHDYSGNVVPEYDTCQHHFAGWPINRVNFFPEITAASLAYLGGPNSSSRLNDAVAKVRGYQTIITNQVAAASTPQAKQAADYIYRISGYGEAAPPAPGQLGPA